VEQEEVMTRPTFRDPAARDRAWARFLRRTVGRVPIERLTYKRLPRAPLSPAERIAAWRQKYARTTIEQQTTPVRPKWPAMKINRTAPLALGR
jgi:hypothetical protein